MADDIISKIIGSGIEVAGQQIQVPIKKIVIDRNLLQHAAGLLQEVGLEGKALLVCDTNTLLALGQELAAVLGIDNEDLLILADGALPDSATIEIVTGLLPKYDFIIAVGSGSINDLCKYASYLKAKPYVIFATAASMNGYASPSASVILNNHKTTVKAHLPQAIFMDLDVIAGSPVRLLKAGVGDAICRSTAQADWLLSHLLLGTAYNESAFVLMQHHESLLYLHNAKDFFADTELLKALCQNLILGGFAMYLCDGSYPASQGEHMIAHTMEMLFKENGDKVQRKGLNIKPYHGEQIAVTTLTMAKMQEEKLNMPALDIDAIISCSLAGQLQLQDIELAGGLKSEFAVLYQEKLNLMLLNLSHGADRWEEIKSKVAKVKVPYGLIYQALKNVECEVEPHGLGWSLSEYNKAVNFAKFTRSRFTFLDI